MSPPLCPISRGGGERVGVKEDNCSPVYRYEALPLVGSSHKDKGRGRGEYRSLGPTDQQTNRHYHSLSYSDTTKIA